MTPPSSMEPEPEPLWVTIPEAAKLLSVSDVTVRYWQRSDPQHFPVVMKRPGLASPGVRRAEILAYGHRRAQERLLFIQRTAVYLGRMLGEQRFGLSPDHPARVAAQSTLAEIQKLMI